MDNNVLIDGVEKKLIIEYLYEVQEYVTFTVAVKSGKFSGETSFCISKENTLLNIEKLLEIQKFLKGTCEIKDFDSDSVINIRMRELGHMDIYGQIGGSHQEQSMKFKISTYQTVLSGLIKVLSSFL